MALQVIKIAEWNRSNSTSDMSVLLLVDKRDTVFVKQQESGESGTEYLKRIDLDLANKTGSETILYTATDGIAVAGLKIFGKGLTTRRFGGYGMVGGDCSYKGDVIDLDDPSKILCLCDGASNCNLTSNVSKLFYDPVSGMILADGGCSGKWIWVIDPSNLSVVGKVSESWIRSRSYCGIELVPRDDEKAFVIIGSSSSTGSKYLRIGLVDVQDIIENAGNTPNVDELGSWQELLSSTSYYRCCWFKALCNGYTISMCLDTGTGKERALYDPSNNTITMLGDLIERIPLFKGWYGIDNSNKKHIIYDNDAQTKIQEISDTDTFNSSDIALWFSLLADTTNQKEILKGLSLDGNTVPWIEWDFENNKFRVIDYITGNPISIDVILVWSRLQSSLSHTGTLPYIANNRVQKITVNGWTSIPQPPTRNVRTLYVIPDLLGVTP